MAALRPGAGGINIPTQPRGDVVRLGFVFGPWLCVLLLMMAMMMIRMSA